MCGWVGGCLLKRAQGIHFYVQPWYNEGLQPTLVGGVLEGYCLEGEREVISQIMAVRWFSCCARNGSGVGECEIDPKILRTQMGEKLNGFAWRQIQIQAPPLACFL